MIVRIDSKKCVSCGKCAEICPVEAVKQDGEIYTIDNSICIHCLACERECPVKAVEWNYDELPEVDNTEEADVKNTHINIYADPDKEKRRKIKKILQIIVEDTIAPVIEKMFLLFIDGAERLFKNKKYR